MGLTTSPSGGNPNAVIGPLSAVDGNVPQFDGITGKLIKDGYLATETPDPFALVLRDADGTIFAVQVGTALLFADTIVAGFETRASSATPVTIEFNTPQQQFVTGTNTNQVFNMDLANSFSAGMTWRFKNLMTGTGTVTINTSGGNGLITMVPGQEALITCRNPSGGTGVASWSVMNFSTFPHRILSSQLTGGGVGYATGAGGSVTQITSRVTGVTIARPCGKIQTDTTALLALTAATFTVTNTQVAIDDTVVACIRSGAVNVKTLAYVSATASGSFNITVHNLDAVTSETGAIVINFAVYKAVVA